MALNDQVYAKIFAETSAGKPSNCRKVPVHFRSCIRVGFSAATAALGSRSTRASSVVGRDGAEVRNLLVLIDPYTRARILEREYQVLRNSTRSVRLGSCHLSMLRHRVYRGLAAEYPRRRICSVAHMVWNVFYDEFRCLSSFGC